MAEVRETSRKPDEIYGILERLSPGSRKLELFGRTHNVQPGWITLGNQLEGTHLVEKYVITRHAAWESKQQTQQESKNEKEKEKEQEKEKDTC